MPLRWWAPKPEVVLLSRAGCHLCEEMLSVVTARVPQVQVRDIDAELAAGRMDEATHDRWTLEVPVLLIDGEQVARWRVTGEELRRELAAAGRRRRHT